MHAFDRQLDRLDRDVLPAVPAVAPSPRRSGGHRAQAAPVDASAGVIPPTGAAIQPTNRNAPAPVAAGRAHDPQEMTP